MEVILAKDHPTLGFVGQRVQVRNGYARNHLIPSGIAVEASSRRGSELKHRLAGIMAVKNKLKVEAEAKAQALKNVNVKFDLKVGQGGKSFGSIGSKDIETELKKSGFEISRKNILLQEPIRSPGEYPVSVKLHSEVVGEVMVNVVADVVVQQKSFEEEVKSSDAAEDEEGLESDVTDFDEEFDSEEEDDSSAE